MKTGSPHCRAAAAGIIKTALDAGGITGRYEVLFEAAAAAALATGAPLMLHVEPGADATLALAFFTKRSVPAKSLIFCHMDRADKDIGRHLEIARAGAYLEYDTIARYKYHSDEQELNLIERILSENLTERLLLSLDTTRERLKSYSGTPGLDFIMKYYLPMLRARGASEAQIQSITVYNPAAALAFRFE